MNTIIQSFRDAVSFTIENEDVEFLRCWAEGAWDDIRRQWPKFNLATSIEAQRSGRCFDFAAHLQRQREWSERTFGPGNRTLGIVDHIRKELGEILAAPDDAEEFVDVVILGLDGLWRIGKTPVQIIEAIAAKQAKNEARQWPDWRTMPADKAIKHVRGDDAETVNFLSEVIADFAKELDCEADNEAILAAIDDLKNSRDLAEANVSVLAETVADVAKELGCEPDGEKILAAIDRVRSAEPTITITRANVDQIVGWAIEQYQSGKAKGDASVDFRPKNCRFRLADEHKTYPRSGCNACGKTIATGLGRECSIAQGERDQAIRSVVEIVKRLASQAAYTLPFRIPDSIEGRELVARLEHARKAEAIAKAAGLPGTEG